MSGDGEELRVAHSQIIPEKPTYLIVRPNDLNKALNVITENSKAHLKMPIPLEVVHLDFPDGKKLFAIGSASENLVFNDVSARWLGMGGVDSTLYKPSLENILSDPNYQLRAEPYVRPKGGEGAGIIGITWHKKIPEKPTYILVKPDDVDNALVTANKTVKGEFGGTAPLKVYKLNFSNGTELSAITTGNPKIPFNDETIASLNSSGIDHVTHKGHLADARTEPAYKDFAFQPKNTGKTLTGVVEEVGGVGKTVKTVARGAKALGAIIALGETFKNAGKIGASTLPVEDQLEAFRHNFAQTALALDPTGATDGLRYGLKKATLSGKDPRMKELLVSDPISDAKNTAGIAQIEHDKEAEKAAKNTQIAADMQRAMQQASDQSCTVPGNCISTDHSPKPPVPVKIAMDVTSQSAKR